MKKVYIAGSFYKNGDSLKDDFRTELLGDEKKLWNECEAYVNVFGETMKYVGPFFYYPEREKTMEDLTEQEVVVKQEKEAVKNCDIFVGYLGEKSSHGTVAELMHAVELGKEVYLYYAKKENERDIKSEYWFPMLMAREIAKENDMRFMMKEVNGAKEFLECIKRVFGMY